MLPKDHSVQVTDSVLLNALFYLMLYFVRRIRAHITDCGALVTAPETNVPSKRRRKQVLVSSF